MRRLAALLILALGLCAASHASAAPRCVGWPGFEAAAQRNGASLSTLAWSPYGAPEKGWTVYAPLVGRALGSDCPADSPGFAWALSRWQSFHHMAATGVFGTAEFAVMKTRWQQERPFVRLRATGVCPEPPPAAGLVTATPAETLADHPMQLTPGAMAAYRAMVAAARRETTGLEPNDYRLVSSFRSPAYDAARCAQDGHCDGVRRASCSAHRTGLAIDIALPPVTGRGLDSTSAENRAHMTGSPAFAWLLANAWRFGFVNYTFEPWHWEWTGPALIRAEPAGP
jgi:hypothetical protein